MMRKQLLLPFFLVILTGCSTLNMDQPAACAPNGNYVGPQQRASIGLEMLPNDRLDFGKNMPVRLVQALNSEFEAVLPLMEGITAASVSIWSPKHGYWTVDAGLKPGQTDRFWAASIGKMATAAIILEMVEEGRIDLSAPISTWLPHYRDANIITVSHLLNHTSGVFSFNADEAQQHKGGYQTPEKLLETTARHPLQFCPGTNWHYSNTGYVMLGLIAEAIDGQSLDEIIKRRISTPLKLNSFRLVQPTDAPNSFVQTANADGADVPGIATIFGAGALASDSDDLLVFLHAYLTGRIISKNSLELAFTDLYPMFGGPMSYGLGVMRVDVPDPEKPTVWLGHSGGSPDVKAIAYYDVARDVYITVMLNNQAPAEALANKLLKVLDAAQ